MSFDLLAPHYRGMELVLAGKKLHRCRTYFLDQIPAPKRILLLGEGPGRALSECACRFPTAEITCLDASQKMLSEARKSSPSPNIQFLHANILTWSPPHATYDLIITNFFLDCFRSDQLQHIIPKIASAATLSSNWLVGDFQLPASGLKRIRAKLILSSMYTFFRAATRMPARNLTPPDQFLTATGYTLHHRAFSEWHLLHTDWWHRNPAACAVC